jgi:hypothetical protein
MNLLQIAAQLDRGARLDIDALTDSAAELRALAQDIEDCNTVDGVWDDEDQRAEHARLLDLAQRLEAMTP